MEGDMYGGPLKGNTPTDNPNLYNAQEIRQWALDTDPGKVSAAGQAFLEFAKAFRGDQNNDLLSFIQTFGFDLHTAWGGVQSGAPEAQTQLSWLWSSAKELADSAEGLGQAVKYHGEKNLKPFKEYFSIKKGNWISSDSPSAFYNDVSDANMKQNSAIGYLDADNGFTYVSLSDDQSTPPDGAFMQTNLQAANAIAQKKLAEHVQTIVSTYDGMPGYISMTLPSGIVPPQQTPTQDPLRDPNNPANPKDPGGPRYPTNTSYPGNPNGPNSTGTHVPAFSPSAQIPHSGSGAIPSTHLPTNATLPPGSTNLSHAPVPGLPTTNMPGTPHLGPSPTIPGGNPPITGGNPPGIMPITPPNLGGNAKLPVNTKLPGNENFPGIGKPKLPGEGKIPGLGESPFGPSAGSPGRGLIGGGIPRGTGTDVPAGAASRMTSEANAANAARAEQAAMEGAAARGPGGMMPMYPPMGGGMGGQNGQERPVTMPLLEEEGVWEAGGDAVPPLIC